MTDIYPIKPLIIENLIPFLKILSILFLVWIFLIFLSNILSKSNQIKKANTNIKSQKTNITNNLTFLEQNIESLSNEHFYKNLYDILSDILEEKYHIYDIKNRTLSEINLKNQEIYNILKAIYYKSFLPSKDKNIEERKKLLEKVKLVYTDKNNKNE